MLQISDKIPATSHPVSRESDIGYVDVAVNNTRQTVAQQLVKSKNTIPHTYNTIDCNVDNLIVLCQKFDNSVSVQDFVIKAAALALRVIPSMNSLSSGSQPGQVNHIHIGIAVGSPHGIVTPVINHADQLNVSSISQIRMVCALCERILLSLKSNGHEHVFFKILGLQRKS